MMLISLASAKRHLNMDHDSDDSLITLYINAASAMVINYLKSVDFLNSSDDVEMDSSDEPVGVPYEVQAATLIMVGHLYRDRDGDTEKAFEMGYLPKPVMALLYPLRDPALS